ncbi:unnamed protein product [Orchesella dallaii]|uniref:SAM domain-containing protein n=1 Tax=Orchesella dallaii TaxID=48710 RepID=A0ABP1S1J8_9HEXA
MDSTEVNRALNQLGLSQYINIFKENEVNDISLESIDKEDIAQLVPVVGHRAMIWNALSKLKSGSVYDSQSSGEISLFDGSLISEQEMIDRGISLGSGLLQTLRKGRSSQIDETPAPFPSAVFQTIPTLVLNSPDSCSVSQLNDERRNNPPRTVPDIQMTRPKERQTQILETPASFTNAVFQGIPNLVFNSPTPCSVSQTNDNCSNNPPETVPDIQMSNSEMHVVNPVRNYSFHQESCQKDDNAEKSYDQGINQTCIQPLKSPDEHISKNIYGFDIQEVLTANVTTKKIVTTKVEENQFILRSDRQAVAAVLIDAVIERSGTNPSKNSLEQLARQLVRKYPGLGDPRRSERGWQMWFFHTVKGQGATGFLEDRLKNQRRRLVKKQTKSDRFMEDAEDINWQSMDEDGKYTFIQKFNPNYFFLYND